VLNKSDLGRKLEGLDWPELQVEVSCRTGEGLAELRETIFELMKRGALPPATHSWAVNQRHMAALEKTRQSLERALGSARSALSPEFIALDLREALEHVGVIIGATYTENILQRIFSDYCIGK
jgi:tRNA modification GTPase